MKATLRAGCLLCFSQAFAADLPVASDAYYQTNTPASAQQEDGLSFGVLYDNVEQATISLELKQHRIFDTDERGRLEFSASRYTTMLRASIVDEDFYETVWSRRIAFSSFQSSENPHRAQSYDFSGARAALSFARPLSERSDLELTLAYDLLDFRSTTDLPLAISTNSVLDNGKVDTLSLAAAYQYATLDRPALPTSGAALTLSLEIGRASDSEYAMTRMSYDNYFAVSDLFFARSKTVLGGGTARSGDYPFGKNIMLGGIGTVRGYQANALGPVSQMQISGSDAAIGGRFAYTSTIEFGALIGPQKKITIFAFGDVGNVADSVGQLRSESYKSQGFGLRWASPLGPLEVSYAVNVPNSASATAEEFQFMIGTSF
jgi:outer membrane protein insertion porin family